MTVKKKKQAFTNLKLIFKTYLQCGKFAGFPNLGHVSLVKRLQPCSTVIRKITA